MTERRYISAHEGSCCVLASLHELLEIVQVVVHIEFLSVDGYGLTCLTNNYPAKEVCREARYIFL
jgi:hypothetical protein